jgi:sugar phosphate isomerase/epimerase
MDGGDLLVMQVGIFETVFPRATFAESIDAVRAHGVGAIQLQTAFEPAEAVALGRACAERGVAVGAVSGAFNMAHPDPAERTAGLAWFEGVVGACPALGTKIVTLCTGSRSRESMWRAHPDNGTPEAWRDMLDSVGKAAGIAERAGVTLAFEPEVANVVGSSVNARQLIDEVRSPALKVCIDGANVFAAGQLPRMAEVLDEMFQLLGDHVAFAHAKDLDKDGQAGHLAAGHGKLDYPRYVAGLKRAGYDGPVVLHGLTEEQAPGCVAFLAALL